jgi:hypothetical protein
MLWGDTLRIARILQYGQETLAKKWKVHHQGRNNLPDRLNFTIRGRRDVIILKGISLLPFKTTMLSIKIEKSPFSAPDN